MTRILPLTWSCVGSDLIKSGAMGTTYTVFRQTTGRWVAQADGLTVYTGEDIEAAKRAIQDTHIEWVSALVDPAEVNDLRAALFTIEIHGGSAETYDPVVDAICREALEKEVYA